jgi:hypothetical protein
MTTKSQATRSMADEGNGGTPDATPTRKQVSKRLYIDPQGGECERIEEATGARYILLAPGGNVDFDLQCGPAGKIVTMAAIMGFHTKVGNVANTVLNDKDEPGTPDDAAQAIREFIAKASDANDPQWAERGAGVAGSRIDKDALAAAIITVAEAAGKTPDYQKIRDRLENEPQYVRAARQVPDVAREYATRVGKAGKTVDDLLG